MYRTDGEDSYEGLEKELVSPYVVCVLTWRYVETCEPQELGCLDWVWQGRVFSSRKVKAWGRGNRRAKKAILSRNLPDCMRERHYAPW